MAERGMLGCVGALVAFVVVVVLGWLSLELVLGAWTVASVDGAAGLFTDPLLCHQTGQLLVVGALILALFTAVFRPQVGAGRVFRIPLWLGAALELVAWWWLPGGSRVSVWALTLAVAGALAPFALERARS